MGLMMLLETVNVRLGSAWDSKGVTTSRRGRSRDARYAGARFLPFGELAMRRARRRERLVGVLYGFALPALRRFAGAPAVTESTVVRGKVLRNAGRRVSGSCYHSLKLAERLRLR